MVHSVLCHMAHLLTAGSFHKIRLVKHLTVYKGNDYKANSSEAKSTQKSSIKIKKCNPLPGENTGLGM